MGCNTQGAKALQASSKALHYTLMRKRLLQTGKELLFHLCFLKNSTNLVTWDLERQPICSDGSIHSPIETEFLVKGISNKINLLLLWHDIWGSLFFSAVGENSFWKLSSRACSVLPVK